ncbi:secretion protein snm4 [Streptomyces sp. NPDC048506]|uniref:secretion protein snm4 n=1 Tax=Streptomyces sp. NPDC048506 TaxID=3155028 RepID=UPI00344984F8
MARSDDSQVLKPGFAGPQSAAAARDLADALAAPLDIRGWAWGERSRTWTAVASSLLLAALTGVCAHAWYDGGEAAPWLATAAVVLSGAGAAVGALAGRNGQRAPGAALLLLGGALGVAAAWQAVSDGSARLATVGLTVAALLALLGLCAGLGRGGLIGAASVALAVGAWELGLALTTPARTGVALGFGSVLVLGQLPRLALTSAGLTRLDDQRSGGTPVSRFQVGGALGAAHRELVPTTLVMAASAGAAGVLAARTPGLWTVLTALLLGVVLCSRARAYPLAAEVVALLAAGLAVGVRLVLLWATDGRAPAFSLVTLGVLAALPVAVLAIRVPEPLRVRLRRWLDLIESVSVVALIPVGLGAFGLYGLLFGTS